jgi:hypothetical protein
MSKRDFLSDLPAEYGSSLSRHVAQGLDDPAYFETPVAVGMTGARLASRGRSTQVYPPTSPFASVAAQPSTDCSRRANLQHRRLPRLKSNP